MKENSIEETIKQLKLMLKVRKEQKEIIECAGGSCINCDPDIKALSESIDILSDYKRVLKENELLRQQNISYKNNIQTMEVIMTHYLIRLINAFILPRIKERTDILYMMHRNTAIFLMIWEEKDFLWHLLKKVKHWHRKLLICLLIL